MRLRHIFTTTASRRRELEAERLSGRFAASWLISCRCKTDPSCLAPGGTSDPRTSSVRRLSRSVWTLCRATRAGTARGAGARRAAGSVGRTRPQGLEGQATNPGLIQVMGSHRGLFSSSKTNRCFVVVLVIVNKGPLPGAGRGLRSSMQLEGLGSHSWDGRKLPLCQSAC